MKKIILIGGGGHSKTVIELLSLINEYKIVGISDTVNVSISGIPIIGDDTELYAIYASGVEYAFNCVGALVNVNKRIKINKLLLDIGFKLPNLIHPTAYVANSCKFGSGNFIGINTVLNSDCVVGNNCIVNTGAIIEHECTLGDYVHLAPKSLICGGSSLANNVFVGAGATVLQQISVAKDSVIGAASLVTKNIETINQFGYGIPFKVIK